MEISIIENGGVTSPEGYLAAGVAAGIKNNGNVIWRLSFRKRPQYVRVFLQEMW